MSAAAAAGTETASWERILTEPGTTGATVAAAVAVCPNADRGSRSRGNGGPSRGQGRRFAGSLSRHPLRYRKPHPPPYSPSPPLADRLPGVAAALPPPAPARSVGLRCQQLPLAAVSARASESQPFYWDRSPASARLVVPEIRLARACSPAAAPDGMGRGWVTSTISASWGLKTSSQPCLRTREHWISSEELCLLSLKEGLGLKERGLGSGMRWGKAERCVLNPIVRKKGFGYLIDVVRIKALYGPLPVSLCYVKWNREVTC